MFAVVHGSYRIRMMSSCQWNSMGTIKSFQAVGGKVVGGGRAKEEQESHHFCSWVVMWRTEPHWQQRSGETKCLPQHRITMIPLANHFAHPPSASTVWVPIMTYMYRRGNSSTQFIHAYTCTCTQSRMHSHLVHSRHHGQHSWVRDECGLNVVLCQTHSHLLALSRTHTSTHKHTQTHADTHMWHVLTCTHKTERAQLWRYLTTLHCASQPIIGMKI